MVALILGNMPPAARRLWLSWQGEPFFPPGPILPGSPPPNPCMGLPFPGGQGEGHRTAQALWLSEVTGQGVGLWGKAGGWPSLGGRAACSRRSLGEGPFTPLCSPKPQLVC